ncbi:MAG TPA: transposase, partial [Anaeromyxobacteraceae bacterium]|nr:transposase [Anaeromyxobacteraceae bacterium]
TRSAAISTTSTAAPPATPASGSRARATACSKTPPTRPPRQLLKLAEVVTTNRAMYRAFLLYGELRYIYKLPKEEARERLEAWLAWASRSQLKPGPSLF